MTLIYFNLPHPRWIYQHCIFFQIVLLQQHIPWLWLDELVLDTPTTKMPLCSQYAKSLRRIHISNKSKNQK